MKRSIRSGRRAYACAVMLCAALALAAFARPADARTWGLRAGITTGPDQWVVGLHEQLAGEHATVAVLPSAEAGFGHNAFSSTVQLDVLYRFRRQEGARPYLGAGGTVYFYDPNDGGNDTYGGLNLVGGVVLNPQDRPRFMVDGRVRLTDHLPDTRVVLAIEF